jgi:hypothetical protein
MRTARFKVACVRQTSSGLLSETTAQLFVPVMFNVGASGQPAPDAPFLMNQTLVKTAAGWRIASILPIPLPPPALATGK